MPKLPRRKKNGKPPPQPELKTPPDIELPPRERHPADELDALLEAPADGAFLIEPANYTPLGSRFE